MVILGSRWKEGGEFVFAASRPGSFAALSRPKLRSEMSAHWLMALRISGLTGEESELGARSSDRVVI